MARLSGIEWTDATWNPWMGCKKVSVGCVNCYMYRDLDRYGKPPEKVNRSITKFDEPLRWKKRGGMAGLKIFTCSWSDFFIADADRWRREAWEIIRSTPEFTYIILTKRPERIKDHLPSDWGLGWPNVWLLISAENQAMYEKRWPVLATLPAIVKGISAEPLLGPIDITHFHFPDWVITGGESDFQNPRPSDPEHFISLRDQCDLYHIPYFHKQNGGKAKINGSWGGRLIEGREHNEIPGSTHG